MNRATFIRLGSFALVLGGTFGTAYGVGSQPAHLITIRQGDLAYTHLHAVDSAAGSYMFSGALPTGTYRMFLQFGYRGEVSTVPFTVVQP